MVVVPDTGEGVAGFFLAGNAAVPIIHGGARDIYPTWVSLIVYLILSGPLGHPLVI